MNLFIDMWCMSAEADIALLTYTPRDSMKIIERIKVEIEVSEKKLQLHSW